MFIRDITDRYHNSAYIQRFTVEVECGNQWKILAHYGDEDSVYILGVYNTQEKARQILEELIKDLGNREYLTVQK